MIENKNISELKKIRNNALPIDQERGLGFYISFFKKFYKKNRVLFFLALTLIVCQTIVELLLLLISRNKLNFETTNNSLLLLFIVFSVLFLLFSYFSIKKEKTLSVYLSNEVRKRIVSFYLNRGEASINGESQSNLIAKISYHLPLLSSFVTKVFFAVIRWFFYFACFVFIAHLIDLSLLWSSLFFVVLSLIIILFSYFISRYYISREVTFYSQILKHISFNFSDKSFLKRFFQEGCFIKKFDRLVDFDSYFRIRRDLWFRLAGKFIFLLVIIIYFFVNFNEGFLNSYFAKHNFNYLFLIFFIIYISRALYEASTIGLYTYPAKLGIVLSVLPKRISLTKMAPIVRNEISFHNRKTKLFLEGAYYRRLSFVFKSGNRYLFTGENLSGKTSLALAFSGLKVCNPLSWKVKIDGQKFNYSFWSGCRPRPYYFDPLFKSARTLLEFVSGKDKEMISMEEVEKNIKKIQKFDLIAQNLSQDANYNIKLEFVFNNFVKSFAAHCAHCLIVKPDVIVIDNLWLDLNYEPINKMLRLISDELNKTSIIVFSKNDNQILSYYKKYEIQSKEIREKK